MNLGLEREVCTAKLNLRREVGSAMKMRSTEIRTTFKVRRFISITNRKGGGG